MQNLSLQVTEVDDVEIDQAEGADASRGEIHGGRRSQPARADAQHLGRLQLPLSLHADLGHDQMPAVAFDLVVGERRQLAVRLRLRGVRLKPDTTHIGVGGRHSTRDRRDDADGVARLHRRLLFLQIPDVFVVHVHVDEAAQASLLVVQMPLQAPVLRRQVDEKLADRVPLGIDRVLLIRVRPERCRNQDFRRHEARPLQIWIGRL